MSDVWRIQVVTSGMNIANYCIKNKVAAMGWCFYGSENDQLVKEREKVRSFQEYVDWYSKYDSKGVNPSVSRLNELQKDDIVWMYSKNEGKYYVGRCTDTYRFNSSSEACKYDACNQASVDWYYYCDKGSGKLPGAIACAFIRGTTFQRINKNLAEEFSQLAFNEASNSNYYKVDYKNLGLNEKNFFALLSNDDCEDLLYFYLYSKYGYICVPSSDKKGTKAVEYELINPKTGYHCYAQVKQTNEKLDASADIYVDFLKSRNKNQSNNPEKIYFFSPNSDVVNADKLTPSGEVVPPTEVYNYAISDNCLLSRTIENWIFLLITSNQNQGTKGVMFDTDSQEHEDQMIAGSKISAYGNSSRYIDSSFNIGDYVLFYSKGKGVIAVAKVKTNTKYIEAYDEKYREVEFVFPKKGDIDNSKYISAKKLKELADHDFYFASTIKVPFIDEKLVMLIIDELKKLY